MCSCFDLFLCHNIEMLGAVGVTRFMFTVICMFAALILTLILFLLNLSENKYLNLHGVLHRQEKAQSFLDTLKTLMSQAEKGVVHTSPVILFITITIIIKLKDF